MASNTTRPITVMQLQNDPAHEHVTLNPYIRLLTDALPPTRITTRWFRWRGVLTDRFDVLHVHWPEFHIRHRTFAGRAYKSVFFAAFLLRIAVTRKAIVRTVHNLRPHEEGSWTERKLLQWLDRLTTLWVVMNEMTPTPAADRTVLIPHGHYREWYTAPAATVSESGRFLAFGRVRAYKGLDELIAAFRDVPIEEGVRLAVMGNPGDDGTREIVENLCGDDQRIDLDLRFIPDEELAEAIALSEVVVLPYRDILNSGSALLALSLNRPVILRDTTSTRQLQEEFGSQWIQLFEGTLTAAKLRHALAELRASDRPDEVDMSRREWSVLADDLATAYERAAAVRSGR